MVTTLLIPTLLWGSEIWWTGAQHIIVNLNPTYLHLARLITHLPKRTRADRLLAASSLPPLKSILDAYSRNYGLHLLCAQDYYSNKATLIKVNLREKGVGLGRICFLLGAIVPPNTAMEVTTDPSDTSTSQQFASLPQNKGASQLITDSSRHLTTEWSFIPTDPTTQPTQPVGTLRRNQTRTKSSTRASVIEENTPTSWMPKSTPSGKALTGLSHSRKHPPTSPCALTTKAH